MPTDFRIIDSLTTMAYMEPDTAHVLHTAVAAQLRNIIIMPAPLEWPLYNGRSTFGAVWTTHRARQLCQLLPVPYNSLAQ